MTGACSEGFSSVTAAKKTSAEETVIDFPF